MEFNLSQNLILKCFLYEKPRIFETKFSLISANLFPYEYKVLSSAKFQISDCSIIMSISLINILNKSGSNIDPCGIPRLIFDHIL